MLSIGAFSNICRVSTKTLRYYAEIGLLAPNEINPDNGYRYYSVDQLKVMLFISRLKEYSFSLDEIKGIIHSEEQTDDALYLALLKKKTELEKKVNEEKKILRQLDKDMETMKHGKSLLDYMEEIDVTLVDVPLMYILSIRKKVQACDYPSEYSRCFGELFKRIAFEHLTVAAPPMVMFHDEEFSPAGLDTEFAIPVKEYATGTRDFCPKLCLKTVFKGAYSNLSSVYAKHQEWMDKEGYEYSDPLYEVYMRDPSDVKSDDDLITEVYSPIRKART